MSKPMILVFHPDAAIADKLQKMCLTMGARVRVVADAGALPGEMRKYGPDVALLPWNSGAAMGDALINLVKEDTPLCRVVLLTEEEHGDAMPPTGIFGSIGVMPMMAADAALAVLKAAVAAFQTEGSVLVVEDQPINLEMVADVLHAKGFRVLRAMTAEDSIELAMAGGPDMILMDIYLPGMNGIDAVRKLKGMASTSAIPIVMLSANGTDSTVTDALESGAIDFVVKPFSPRRLLEKVALVLEKRDLLAHA